MITQELLDYVKKTRDQGFSDQQIIVHLMKFGYSYDDASSAVSKAIAPVESPVTSSQESHYDSQFLAAEEPKEEKQQLVIDKRLVTASVLGFILISIFGGIFFMGFGGPTGLFTESGEPEIYATDHTGIFTTCDDFACFESAFELCQQASAVKEIVDGAVYYYEIHGVERNLCKTKVHVLTSFNENLVNKKMICYYDNALGFSNAVLDRSTCTGELAEAFT